MHAMPDSPAALAFDRSFKPEPDAPAEAAPGIVRVTAGNGGPFTFTGTNSFIIGEHEVMVLDPGPDDATHRAALLAEIGGRPVKAILLTHTHLDHSAGAAALKAATGAPLWFGGRHRLSRPAGLFEFNPLSRGCDWKTVPDRVLVDGEEIEIGGVRLVVIATPGHCANHLSFGVAGSPWLLTGDHVMGWNSTLVAVPDGSMADYLESLSKVIDLPYASYLPAHGGPIANGPAYARALLAHRRLRNSQIVEAVNGGVTRIGALVSRIYPALRGQLRFAARMTITAHIEYLEAAQLIVVRRGIGGTLLLPV